MIDDKDLTKEYFKEIDEAYHKILECFFKKDEVMENKQVFIVFNAATKFLAASIDITQKTQEDKIKFINLVKDYLLESIIGTENQELTENQ